MTELTQIDGRKFIASASPTCGGSAGALAQAMGAAQMRRASYACAASDHFAATSPINRGDKVTVVLQ